MDTDKLKELRAKGLSYRKIGLLVGLSGARVHQLLSGYDVLLKELNGKGTYYYQRDYIFTRDNHKCALCDSVKSLIVHHIDSNDRNRRDNNLITLCVSCHTRLHHPKQAFKAD